MARSALRKESTGGESAVLIDSYNAAYNSNSLLALAAAVMDGRILLIEDETTDYGYRVELNRVPAVVDTSPSSPPPPLSVTTTPTFVPDVTESIIAVPRSESLVHNGHDSLATVPENLSIDFSTIYSPQGSLFDIAKSSLAILQKQTEIIDTSKKYKSKIPSYTEKGFLLLSTCVLLGYLSDRGDARASYFLSLIDEAIAYGSLKADLAETMDKFKDPLSQAIEQLEQEGIFNF